LHDVVQPDIGRDLVLLQIPSTSQGDDSIMEATGGQRESPMNLSFYLTESAEMYPQSAALRCEGTTTTYSALCDNVTRFAASLIDDGVKPGDRLGVMLPNRPEFAVVFYGALHAGAVVVPMNPLQSAREVEFFLTNTGTPKLFFAPECAAAATAGALAAGATPVVIDGGSIAGLPSYVPAHSKRVPRAGHDTAVILHTSGTTGVPKGAELSHDNLVRNQAATARGPLNLGPDDVVMGCLPLFHAFGMTCGLGSAMSTGATLALLPRFDPGQALKMLAAERVTVFEGAPTTYSAMLAAANRVEADVSSLRLCISCGAAMPADTLRRFEDRFGCTVLEGYGLSETSPVACFNHPNAVRKVGSIGTPINGVQMRVVDEAGNELPAGTPGEVQIRGHNVMKGYWNLPEATGAAIVDGWLSTGDIGRVDDDGYFYIVDQKEHLIIRGGYNVYPREIEEVLHDHPAVDEVAVIGIPHDTLGEEVGAAVALAEDEIATPAQLQTYVKERVAAHKYPRHIWFVDELPKGPTGKILRRNIAIPIEVTLR
jgi:long-chain acyl-CoA synthetase